MWTPAAGAPPTTVSGLGVALSETTNADSAYTVADHFSGYLTLNPGETAHLQLKCVYGVGGSDVFFRVVAALGDTAAELPDTVAYATGIVPYTSGATVYKSFFVTGPFKFRIEVRKGGAVAGTYTPTLFLRKNGINIA